MRGRRPLPPRPGPERRRPLRQIKDRPRAMPLDSAVMPQTGVLPAVPLPPPGLLRLLPLLPLRLALQRIVASVARRRPALFARLGGHAEKRFLIDPTDLPFVLCLRPRPEQPTLEPRRRGGAGTWDARIAGPFGALIGMLHGAFDGDALFFSGDIVIEGDTEAVLALRSALDDAELDLLIEAAAAAGPTGPLLERAGRDLLPVLSRVTGLALTRAE